MTNDTNATDRAFTLSDLWWKTPRAWKAAVIMAAFGWLLAVGYHTTEHRNGVLVSCDGMDFGPFIAGGLIVLLLFGGWRGMRNGHPARRLPKVPALVVGGILAAAAAFYLISGILDPAGSFC